MDFNAETFRDRTVDFDDNAFIECTFDNVVARYGGGRVDIVGCTFIGTFNWQFTGDLARGLETVRRLAHDGGPRHVKSTVDALAAFLRRSDAPTVVSID